MYVCSWKTKKKGKREWRNTTRVLNDLSDDTVFISYCPSLPLLLSCANTHRHNEIIYANIHQNVNCIFRMWHHFAVVLRMFGIFHWSPTLRTKAWCCPIQWLCICTVLVPPAYVTHCQFLAWDTFFLLHLSLALCKDWTSLSVCLDL